MNISIRKLLGFVTVALLLTVCGLALYAWHSSAEDRAQMQQTIEDQQKIIEASKATMKQTQATLEARLEEIRKQVAQIKTPEQAARAIPQVIPGVQPLIVQVPQQAPTAQSPEPAKLAPSASGDSAEAGKTVTIPLEQMPTLYQFAQSCHECEVKLDAAQVDRKELVRQMQALEEQRNAAIKAAKGGSFWTRFKRDLKSGAGATGGAALGAAACSKSGGPAIAICAGAGALTGFLISHF